MEDIELNPAWYSFSIQFETCLVKKAKCFHRDVHNKEEMSENTKGSFWKQVTTVLLELRCESEKEKNKTFNLEGVDVICHET